MLLIGGIVLGDGMVVPPRDYEGSLEERAQEAIIVFLEEGQEDLILKITVHGAAAGFAWIVPFPNEPTVHKADKKIFRELFDYVQARRVRTRKGKNLGGGSTWQTHIADSGASGANHHDGMVPVDMDGDGDLDLLSLSWNSPIKVRLLENKAID